MTQYGGSTGSRRGFGGLSNAQLLMLDSHASRSLPLPCPKTIFCPEIPLPRGYFFDAPERALAGQFPFLDEDLGDAANRDSSEVLEESRRSDNAPLIYGTPAAQWIVCGSSAGLYKQPPSATPGDTRASRANSRPIVGPWDSETHSLINTFMTSNFSSIE